MLYQNRWKELLGEGKHGQLERALLEGAIPLVLKADSVDSRDTLLGGAVVRMPRRFARKGLFELEEYALQLFEGLSGGF